LAADPECGYPSREDVEVYIQENEGYIQITAVEISGQCPKGQQYVLSMPESESDGWQ
jgi:hypothetical protein